MKHAETIDLLEPAPPESEIEDSYNLTPMQQGMLFQTLYAPEAGSYIRQILCELREELNVGAFRQAWQYILYRHPILRATVEWIGMPEPAHRIHKHIPIPMQEQDWQDLPISEQQQRLEEYAQLERQRGFDLTSGSAMRLALIRLAPADYRFVWTFHHILSDKYSDVLLLKELFSFYDSLCDGKDLHIEQAASFK